MTKEHSEKKRHSKRSVTLYLVILFSVAILFLLLAYLQERAYAQTAAALLGMI